MLGHVEFVFQMDIFPSNQVEKIERKMKEEKGRQRIEKGREREYIKYQA